MGLVKSMFFKKMNPGDLWNIDRPKGTVSGGGGQTYINFGEIIDSDLGDFLNNKEEFLKGNEVSISVKSMDNINHTKNITFIKRTGARTDYRIVRQHVDRHPAWTSNNNFPTVLSTSTNATDVATSGVTSDLYIYIIKTDSDEYFAGFLNSRPLPDYFMRNSHLKNITSGSSARIINLNPLPIDIKDVNDFNNSQDIVDILDRTKNVLLYGPPGTGKTFFMQNMWKHLSLYQKYKDNLYISIHNNSIVVKASPLEEFFASKNIRKEWVTFHQSYSYEEFIIGRIPESTISGGISLTPKLGVLMDVVDDVIKNDSVGFIFIDELNRGNVSKIFGQFITFMEDDKRGWLKDGNINSLRIPVTFPELKIDVTKNKTEEVFDQRGNRITLEAEYYFPYNIYIVSSMNSVDRAVTPLDSALWRRFDTYNFGVDYDYVLSNIDSTSIDESDPTTWNVKYIAYRILRNCNEIIYTTLGHDYELGHSAIQSVLIEDNDDIALENLIKVWELKIFPQMQDRYTDRLNILLDLIRYEDLDSSKESIYPYIITQSKFGNSKLITTQTIKSLNLTKDQKLDLMRHFAQ